MRTSPVTKVPTRVGACFSQEQAQPTSPTSGAGTEEGQLATRGREARVSVNPGHPACIPGSYCLGKPFSLSRRPRRAVPVLALRSQTPG